jgi:hypothetical protein
MLTDAESSFAAWLAGSTGVRAESADFAGGGRTAVAIGAGAASTAGWGAVDLNDGTAGSSSSISMPAASQRAFSLS